MWLDKLKEYALTIGRKIAAEGGSGTVLISHRIDVSNIYVVLLQLQKKNAMNIIMFYGIASQSCIAFLVFGRVRIKI